jgi:hypothetical protein
MLLLMELVVLVVAVATIVAMARTRGASPLRYGLLAAGGWFGLGLMTWAAVNLLGQGDAATANVITFVGLLVQWVYLGAVALAVRFATARGIEGPSGSWSCPQCRSLNQSYALKCDSCGEAWSRPGGGAAVA